MVQFGLSVQGESKVIGYIIGTEIRRYRSKPLGSRVGYKGDIGLCHLIGP